MKKSEETLVSKGIRFPVSLHAEIQALAKKKRRNFSEQKALDKLPTIVVQLPPDGGNMAGETRLSRRLDLRLSKTLEYELTHLSRRFKVKPSDAARLALYLLVERYPPACGKELEDEFYKEIGMLRFRDSISLQESKNGEPVHGNHPGRKK